MRKSKVAYMMAIAELTQQQSTCSRLQVGCVLSDLNYENIWVGYNGGPRGGANGCRHPDKSGGCGCVHAEANAVVKAPGSIEKLAFLTVSPCITCAAMLVNAHVTEVTYTSEYRSTDGISVLKEVGVTVRRYP
jgi:dCMP deaminase